MDTKHFNPEVDTMMSCPCCGEGELPLVLLVVLEHLRDNFNSRPVTITSGARCESHNSKVCGSSGSQHLIRGLHDIDQEYALAVDIQVKDIHPMTVYEYLDQLPYAKYLGLGYYEPRGNGKGWVHLDVRGDWLGDGRLDSRWEG